MPKYNLSSNSDMNRFARDLERRVLKAGKNAVRNASHETTCPNCKATMTLVVGENISHLVTKLSS